jgi:hypothetical protein
MIDNNDFINFFFIKKNRFLITSFLKTNLKCLYKNELILDNSKSKLINDQFKQFLDLNIHKIEKLNNQFIKDINLVIYNDNFLPINVGIKTDISRNFNFEKERLNLLSKIKNEIELNNKDLSIIHLLLDNILINDEYIDIKKNEDKIVYKYLSIETTFVLFPLLKIFEYQKIFADYQITINKIISGDYLNKESESLKISELDAALSIFLGNSFKEVILSTKKPDNKGIFEKFFYLFS